MAYALTAEALLGFGRRFTRTGGALSAWAPFVDKVGPALLPLIILPDRYDEIPLVALGYSSAKLSALVPQPGEMWVLFCYRNSFRETVGKGSALRTDGFPLILEWRKDMGDSPLLSAAFHRLADQVRIQLGVEGWGLCPAYARFGDKIAFTDTVLFGDGDVDSHSIVSAYGAVLAGLSSAISGRHPPFWPFPTLQWDKQRRKPCGVAGLPEKLSVAADCGASVVTVANEQKREAKELLAKLKASEEGRRYGRLSVSVVRDVDEPKLLARRICEVSADHVRIRRIVMLGVAIIIGLFSAVVACWLDWRREKIEYYADYVERAGIAEGRFRLSYGDVSSRGRAYQFRYRGYDSINPLKRKRVLRELWCVNGKGAIRVDESDCPEHPPVTGFRYHYDERGRVAEVERCVAGGRVWNVVRYSGENADVADVIHVVGGRIASGSLKFTASKVGDVVRRIEYMRNSVGFVTNLVFRRDSSGMVASDGHGVSQMSFELLGDGRISAQRYFDWRGNPVENANGVQEERFFYDGDKLSRIQYRGLEGRPVHNPCQEDERIYTYSPLGSFVKVEKKRDGCLREMLTYDRNTDGDIVKEKYVWDEGVKHTKDWTARAICFDDGGNVIRETFFDSSGEKWQRADGLVATVSRKFSVDGDMEEEMFLDEHGRLMLGHGGWALRKLKHERSASGHVVWRWYFGEDRLPMILMGEGMSGEKKSFDVMGRVVEWELFGVGGEKVDGKLGWQRAAIEYGRDGKVLTTRLYDKSGKLLGKED